MKIIPYRPDIGQEYYNPFKEKGIYPFCEIGRCITNKDSGEIKRWCHELDSTLDRDGNDIAFDKNTEDYMVYIPAFYYKRVWEGDVLKDSILTRVPDTVEYEGYKVHPAFIKKDGTIRKYILISAFSVSNVKNQLRSIPGLSLITNRFNNISSMRSNAINGRKRGFGITNIYLYNAIIILFKVAFSTLDIKYISGSQSNGKDDKTTGATLSIGNRSGLSSNLKDCSVFGIEDLFNGITSFIDGIMKKNNEIFITNDIDSFGNIEKYNKVNINFSSNKKGSVKKINVLEDDFSFFNFPDQTGGVATNNTFYCSNFNMSYTSINDVEYVYTRTEGVVSVEFDTYYTNFRYDNNTHLVYMEE